MGTQANRLGWVTKMQLNPTQNFVDVTSYADRYNVVIPTTQEMHFILEGFAVPTPGVYEQLRGWMANGIFSPTFVKEWPCLYCTSPNIIFNTHCTQCGAPRSFVLG